MSNMGVRIKELRERKELTQEELGNMLGLGKSAIAKYENGRVENIKRSIIEQISEILECKPSYLMGWEDEEAQEQEDLSALIFKIPLLGRVVAGEPMLAEQNIEEYIECPIEMKSKADFALRVKGDSMSPILLDGDIVIVHKQESVENGETAIVMINGDEATVKKFMIQENGITLIGHNTAVYSPHFYSAKDVQSLPVKVIGKVVQMRRNF